MKSPILRFAFLIPLALIAQQQQHRETVPSGQSETRLPNGKLQQDEILQSDHEKAVKDAAQLIDLAESLKQEIEKDDKYILSVSSLKKTEEIERLARRIRARLKHL